MAHRVRARIFERGVGETLSSGTGASGAAVAAHLRGAPSPITVILDGGELEVEIGPELEVAPDRHRRAGLRGGALRRAAGAARVALSAREIRLPASGLVRDAERAGPIPSTARAPGPRATRSGTLARAQEDRDDVPRKISSGTTPRRVEPSLGIDRLAASSGDAADVGEAQPGRPRARPSPAPPRHPPCEVERRLGPLERRRHSSCMVQDEDERVGNEDRPPHHRAPALIRGRPSPPPNILPPMT